MEPSTTKSLGQRFQNLVVKLFQAEGFRVQIEPKSAIGTVPDLLVSSGAGATAVVEIKLYRSRSVPVSVLHQAAISIEAFQRDLQAKHAIPVIGSQITALARKGGLQRLFPDLVVYDINNLAYLDHFPG